MPGSADEDLAFIMTCIKHTENRGKPDFASVAEELGLKPSTCYHRHWGMLKKWGLTGSKAANAGSALNGAGTTPLTPLAKGKRGSASFKRGGKKKNNSVVYDDADDDDDDDKEQAPPKKVKHETEAEDKKIKTSSEPGIEQSAIEIEDSEDAVE